MNDQSKVRKGFSVACPGCGAEGQTYVDINDVTTLHCGTGCTTTAAELRVKIGGWQAMLEWLETAPTIEEPESTWLP